VRICAQDVAVFPLTHETVTSQSIAICCVTAAYCEKGRWDLGDRRCHSAVFWVYFGETWLQSSSLCGPEQQNQSFVYKAIPISFCGTLRSLLLAIRWKLYMIELIARANAMAVLEVKLLSSSSQLESPEGLVHWFLLESNGYDGLHGDTRT